MNASQQPPAQQPHHQAALVYIDAARARKTHSPLPHCRYPSPSLSLCALSAVTLRALRANAMTPAFPFWPPPLRPAASRSSCLPVPSSPLSPPSTFSAGPLPPPIPAAGRPLFNCCLKQLDGRHLDPRGVRRPLRPGRRCDGSGMQGGGSRSVAAPPMLRTPRRPAAQPRTASSIALGRVPSAAWPPRSCWQRPCWGSAPSP